jgi:UDP-glucose 4-epimerase
MKITILGGAGFIGSHLTDLLIENGNFVCVYDDLSKGRLEFLPKENEYFFFLKGDILDSQALKQHFDKFAPDFVYHLAAIHHIPSCEKDPEKALRVNVEGTQSVLTACKESGINKIIFTSTGAVYDVCDNLLSEDSPLKPRDVYGISKIAGESLMELYALKNERQAIIARLFNAVGGRETNSHIVPDILEQVKNGKREIELGNLEPRRDYIHVKDIADALFKLGSTQIAEKYDILNIGSGHEYSVRDLVDLCSEIIGEPLRVVSIPARRRKIDRISQLANLKKMAKKGF